MPPSSRWAARPRRRRCALQHRGELGSRWSWDLTKLKGPAKWTYSCLHVVLDVFSRYVVGWMVATEESCEQDASSHSGSFFDWYNHEHRHGSLGLCTPYDVHHRMLCRLRLRRTEMPCIRACTETSPEERHPDSRIRSCTRCAPPSDCRTPRRSARSWTSERRPSCTCMRCRHRSARTSCPRTVRRNRSRRRQARRRRGRRLLA